MTNAEKRRIVIEFVNNPVLMLGMNGNNTLITRAINLRYGTTLSKPFVGQVRKEQSDLILNAQAEAQVNTKAEQSQLFPDDDTAIDEMSGPQAKPRIAEGTHKAELIDEPAADEPVDQPVEEPTMDSGKNGGEIKLFTFPITSQTVRVIFDEDGKPWWVASDVCRVLGYVKTWDAINRHCKPKGTAKRGILTNGGMQEVTVINEFNLYRLMNKSEAPNAEPFQDWVCEELIPSVRETGKYDGGFGGSESRQKAAPDPESQKQIESSIKIDPHVMNMIKTVEGKSKYSIQKAALRYAYESSGEKSLKRGEWLSLEMDAVVIKDYTGEDVLAEIRPKVFLPDTDKDLSAKDIAKAILRMYKINLTPQRINILLINAGLQLSYRDEADRIAYTLTREGEKYGIIATAPRPGGGTYKNQRWCAKVVDIAWKQYRKDFKVNDSFDAMGDSDEI